MLGSAIVVWLLTSTSAVAHAPEPLASDLRGAKALSGQQLLEMLPGNRLVYLQGETGITYRGIEFEAFWRRPGADAVARNTRQTPGSSSPPYAAYTIQYSSFGSGGSYRIDRNMICTAEVRAKENCRSLFRLSNGGFALATFEKPSVPAARVHLRPAVEAAAISEVETARVGKPLKGAALYVALNDAYVEPVRTASQANVRNWPGEIFQSNGIYAQVSSGTRLYGSYSVQGDAVCVKGDGIDSRCRHVVPKADGTYSFVDVSSGLKARVVIKPRRSVDSWDSSTKVIDYQGVKYVKITGADLKLALYWRRLSHAEGSLLSVRYLRESFLDNDVYELIRQEAPFIYGTWNVTGDMVCVEEAGRVHPLCRNVYMNSNRTFVLMVEDSGDRRHYMIGPVKR